MLDTPTSLQGLTAALRAAPGELPLVFATGAGEIGPGYHVTELKLADVTSIDCAGRRHAWRETVLQLLDGAAGRHMTVGKFLSIARRSADVVEDLSDQPLWIEFAHQNKGLERHRVVDARRQGDRVLVSLGIESAACKPAADFARAEDAAEECCGRPRAKVCCG